MATEFDINNPPPDLSREQIRVLHAEQLRLANSTPVPTKRPPEAFPVVLAPSGSGTKASAASRTARGASTMFSGKGTDEILSGDVYDIKESTALNSVFESAKGGAKSAVDFLKGQGGSTRDILRTALDLKAGFITPMDALSRIGVGLNPATFMKIKDGASGILDTVANGLGINPDIINELKVGVSGAFSYITNNNLLQPQGAFDVMKGLLNEPELLQFFDIQAETSLLTGMFKDAVDYGMTDVIGFVSESSKYDLRSFEYAVMSVSGSAIENGNISTIDKLLDYITPEQFLGQNPNAINLIAGNYTLGDLITPDLYPAKLTELTGVMDKLDTNWMTKKVNDVVVNNYGAIASMSEDAIKLMKTNPVTRELALVAPFYPPASAVELGKLMYPTSAIGSIA